MSPHSDMQLIQVTSVILPFETHRVGRTRPSTSSCLRDSSTVIDNDRYICNNGSTGGWTSVVTRARCGGSGMSASLPVEFDSAGSSHLTPGDRRLCTQCLARFKARPRRIGHATRVTHASLDRASMVRPTLRRWDSLLSEMVHFDKRSGRLGARGLIGGAGETVPT